MSDAPKSAWEIALEKLNQQDKERGESAPVRLTDAQKKAIASARQRSEARLAEAEILHRSSLAKAGDDPEALAKVEEEYRIDRRRIEDQRDREIAGVRAGKDAKKK
ncbi:MAG TPA: hypothetical protein VJV75_12275 [Candidatus Polarisedimenticolia bacterium]|nr:hypothetical protein [Candidatus Polarisedimenticolia bacterium]